jgi:hypothetical protein
MAWRVLQEESKNKHFFFEKKKQKTLLTIHFKFGGPDRSLTSSCLLRLNANRRHASGRLRGEGAQRMSAAHP